MTTPDNAEFRRSSFCTGGSCIEIGFRTDRRVAIRDASRPRLAHLVVSDRSWSVFLAAVRAGEFQR
jgi:hypothetical protein